MVDDIKVLIKSEGVDDVGEELEELEDKGFLEFAGEDGESGEVLGSLLAQIKGMSTAMLGVLGVLGAIAGVLFSMEPIREMMSAFLNIIQAFFIPVAKVIISLLAPLLRFMARMLPRWFEFVEEFAEDPLAAIENAFADMIEFFGEIDLLELINAEKWYEQIKEAFWKLETEAFTIDFGWILDLLRGDWERAVESAEIRFEFGPIFDALQDGWNWLVDRFLGWLPDWAGGGLGTGRDDMVPERGVPQTGDGAMDRGGGVGGGAAAGDVNIIFQGDIEDIIKAREQAPDIIGGY